jgi:hypothetical protein
MKVSWGGGDVSEGNQKDPQSSRDYPPPDLYNPPAFDLHSSIHPEDVTSNACQYVTSCTSPNPEGLSNAPFSVMFVRRYKYSSPVTGPVWPRGF